MYASEKYVTLIREFSGNKNLIELLQTVVNDDIIDRERDYIKNAQYPEQRNLIGKIIIDLMTAREAIKNEMVKPQDKLKDK